MRGKERKENNGQVVLKHRKESGVICSLALLCNGEFRVLSSSIPFYRPFLGEHRKGTHIRPYPRVMPGTWRTIRDARDGTCLGHLCRAFLTPQCPFLAKTGLSFQPHTSSLTEPPGCSKCGKLISCSSVNGAPPQRQWKLIPRLKESSFPWREVHIPKEGFVYVFFSLEGTFSSA